jgi:hypothetical protein
MASAGRGGLPRASLLSEATDIVETFGSRVGQQGSCAQRYFHFFLATRFLSAGHRPRDPAVSAGPINFLPSFVSPPHGVKSESVSEGWLWCVIGDEAQGSAGDVSGSRRWISINNSDGSQINTHPQHNISDS